mmetsp:Transcript_23667/g.73733  ORF Transcript_23667/g.73733 Transcript_23667/m.73733 type:complete len:267 (+) Transcript_23667:108-908(+)
MPYMNVPKSTSPKPISSAVEHLSPRIARLPSSTSTDLVCAMSCELTAPRTFVTQRWEMFTRMAMSTDTTKLTAKADCRLLLANASHGSPRSLMKDHTNIMRHEVQQDHASKVYSSNLSFRAPVMTSCWSTLFTERMITERIMHTRPPTETLRSQGCTAVMAPATTTAMGASRTRRKGRPISRVRGTEKSGLRAPMISANSGDMCKSPTLARPTQRPKHSEMGKILERNSQGVGNAMRFPVAHARPKSTMKPANAEKSKWNAVMIFG